jgi:hypothetical protein
MAGTPKENLEKINAVITAWTTLRPEKTFGGMTLAQFKTKVQPSLDSRASLSALESQVIATQNRRDDADQESVRAAQLVVNAVKGDPAEGEDGELYEALGYVRKSERNSGLHRATAPAAPKA